MKNNQLLDIETASKLIDFSGNHKRAIRNESMETMGTLQLEGAVAIYNKIIQNGLGYIADEVGMGKTYISIGVVSLLRYFNPSLRVLYILPKQNILTKWYKTDFRNFLENNFLQTNYRVKVENGISAVPQVECVNLIDLIKHSSTGYYGDYFIKMSSFSFGMHDKDLKRQLENLKEILPAYNIPHDFDDLATDAQKKERVKVEYAQAINKILPHFDLVVIDEAHNLRKGFDSSDRNRIMSIVLGTYNGSQDYSSVKKVDNGLLLSATPFESSLSELKNQLAMVGYEKLIDVEIAEKEKRNAMLSKLMVRRLNILKVNEKKHSRNMYRNEYRAEAAIDLDDTDYKQKLIVALVQKKVGELIREMKGQYQTGMFASFESYLPSSQRIDVEFDGQQELGEAKDASLIAILNDSYAKTFQERNLPHPKMDKTVQQYGRSAFGQGEKHLIFVRRIQSVKDLKNKFDDYYDVWIKKYLEQNIKDSEKRRDIVTLFDAFKSRQQFYKENENMPVEERSDFKEEAKPSNNNFFTYFFRGDVESDSVGYPKPLTFRKYLTDHKKYDLGKLFLENGNFFERLEKLGLSMRNNIFYKELVFSFLRLGHGFIDMYIAYLNGGREGFLDEFIAMLEKQKKDRGFFSTYNQLKDLCENFEVIVKTNFNSYADNPNDWRNYIRKQLSPLEPIAGAKGGDDKSAIARKFRMPGYPMILIATDVFQEGEDLHTFCDSVIHYGLSATPIAIEQKTGRVDRIGSLAQRRLQRAGADIKEDGIKVFFPHIRESIEVVQVRNIANRLNLFLESLHEFESNQGQIDVNSDRALEDHTAIPALTKKELKSPFEILESEIHPLRGSLVTLDIEKDLRYIEEIQKHISSMIDVKGQNVRLVHSSNPYEMILKISNVETTVQDSNETLREFIERVSNKQYRRCLYKCRDENGYHVVEYDVHLLVGGEHLTQASEIEELQSRLINEHFTTMDQTEIDIRPLFEPVLLETELFVRNHTVNVELEGNNMLFTFQTNKLKRSQNVLISQDNGYVVLTSKSAKWDELKRSDSDLVKFTWERNRHIDIVEFMLDQEGWLIGRIVHPANTMQAKEFMYYAYILACEADHLEQVLNDFEYGDRY